MSLRNDSTIRSRTGSSEGLRLDPLASTRHQHLADLAMRDYPIRRLRLSPRRIEAAAAADRMDRSRRRWMCSRSVRQQRHHMRSADSSDRPVCCAWPSLTPALCAFTAPFSPGCVIAELFMNGESVLFDLPNLLAYREGSYDPSPTIAKIPYPLVRQLIHHMIQRDPAKRFSAKQYIKLWSEGGGMGLEGEAVLPSNEENSSKPVDPLLSPSLAPASSPSPSAALIGSALFPPYFPYLYKFFAKLLSPDLADPDIKIAVRGHSSSTVTALV